MKRREFMTLVGGAAAVWPLAGRAQFVARTRRIGILTGQAIDDPEWIARFDALKGGLQDLGWNVGRDIVFEYRHATGTPEQLSTIVGEMASSGAEIILVGATSHAVLLRKATSTIPIISMSVAALKEAGLIEDLNRPGGNVTGIEVLGHELMSKRVGLLHELLPNLSKVGMIEATVTANAAGRRIAELTVETARALNIEVQRVQVGGPIDFEPAFMSMLRDGCQAAFVPANPLTTPFRNQIIDIVAQHRLPTVYDLRMFVVSGGLLSYGFDLVQLARAASRFVDKVLRGTNPADLPVEQPTKFELVVNLKAAKSLGLEMPPTLLALADEVIE